MAKRLGTPFMPWQQHVANIACEIDPATGLFVYREVTLTVPRQSGKTTLILAKSTHRCIAYTRQVAMYAMQSRNDARKKWEDDYLAGLDLSQFRGQYRARKTNGNEAIIWHRSKSRFGITSNTEKAGHGSTIDEAYIDEAFAQPDARLEQAFKPAMITRSQPQLWVVSTAGTPKKSKYFHGKVKKGRRLAERGIQTGVAYFEWSLPDDLDPGDPRNWWKCMPALGHTISEDAIRADYISMELDEFRRAYLNQWVDADRVDPVIPLTMWAELVDMNSEIDNQGLALAVDTSPDRHKTSIAAWGMRKDGRHHIEVVDYRDGTAWVIDRCVELWQRWNPRALVIDPVTAAGAFIEPLTAKGIPVLETTAREVVQATGALYDLVLADRVRHIDQPELNTALENAAKRELEGAWTWSRRKSTDDISPIVAVTLAWHGYHYGKNRSYNVLDSVPDF